MKRTELRMILKNEELDDESKSKELLDLFHTEIDKIKDERDLLKDELSEAKASIDKMKAESEKNASEWQEKYEKEHNAFEKYKTELSTKAERDIKVNLYRKLLQESNIVDTAIDNILDLTKVDELEVENGQFKNAEELKANIAERWKGFVLKTETTGTKTTTPPEVSKATLTRKEIEAIKDTSERQKAIAEHLDLFK